MDLIEARSDGSEQVLASGLTPSEVDGILNWWRYTKPVGPGVKIVVRDPSGSILVLNTAGTALGERLG